MEVPEISHLHPSAARVASDFAGIEAIPQNRKPDSPVEHSIASPVGNSRPDLFFAAMFFHGRPVIQHWKPWQAAN